MLPLKGATASICLASVSLVPSRSVFLFLSLQNTRTHSLTHTHTHAHTLTPTRTHTHPHTHTHTHTHTSAHARLRWVCVTGWRATSPPSTPSTNARAAAACIVCTVQYEKRKINMKNVEVSNIEYEVCTTLTTRHFYTSFTTHNTCCIRYLKFQLHSQHEMSNRV